MSVFRTLVVSSILTIGLSTTLLAQTARQHGAHEHGVSKLTIAIAIDTKEVQFMLVSPAADIVGFEHMAENADQETSVTSALELLSAPSNLFDLPHLAGCSLAFANLGFALHDDEENHQEGEVKHEEHEGEEEGHAEFHAAYSFTCSSPSALKTIGIKFFDLFPNAEEIELEAVSDFGQMAAEIPRDMRHIDLSSILQ